MATVSTKDTFAIYRSDGQQQETWNCNDLMKRWEDKTKKKESIDINLAMNKNLQSTPVKRKQQGNPIMKRNWIYLLVLRKWYRNFKNIVFQFI